MIFIQRLKMDENEIDFFGEIIKTIDQGCATDNPRATTRARQTIYSGPRQQFNFFPSNTEL